MILRNMFSMSGLNVLKAVASLVVSTSVASAVPPAQYGLVAFAIPFVAFITLVTDLGLASAIIRDPDLDREQAGSAFCFMVAAGLLGGLLLFLTSSWIEKISALSGLAPLLIGFSLVTALSICATTPRALMERTLDYGRIAAIEGISMVIGVAAFAIAVRMSLGIFSLVIYHISLQATRAITFAIAARHLVTLNLDFQRITKLVKFGLWLFFTNLLSYAARNAGTLMIGAFLGASALGLYGLASQFMTIPLMLISWPVSGVLLSTIARMKGDDQKQAAIVCGIITATTAVSFPMMTFLAFGARFPMTMMYGHRWDGLAHVVMLLAPVGAIQSIAVYNGAVLIERGAVRLNFALAIVNGIGLSGIFILARWIGFEKMMITYSVSAVFVSLLFIYFMCVVGSISLAKLVASVAPGAIAAVAGVLVTMLTKGLSPQTFTDWIEETSVYVGTVAVAFLINRGRLFVVLNTFTTAARLEPESRS